MGDVATTDSSTMTHQTTQLAPPQDSSFPRAYSALLDRKSTQIKALADVDRLTDMERIRYVDFMYEADECRDLARRCEVSGIKPRSS